MQKLDKPTIQKTENFYNLSFFNSSYLGFESKKKNFFSFLVDILPLGSISVDTHIFAEPDLGSQKSCRFTGSTDMEGHLKLRYKFLSVELLTLILTSETYFQKMCSTYLSSRLAHIQFLDNIESNTMDIH